jgi:hypothetical protein
LPERSRRSCPDARRCFNTWELEEKTWFWSLLSLGLLGFGVAAMIGFGFAGPDGAKQSGPRLVSSAAASS